MRQDLYFFFMEGSWLQFMVASAFIYVFLNVAFAGLYALDPASIAGGASFERAFFFSVQTMSTIGYGALSPTNAYGDVLASAESWVGILFGALVTGLVFAKASRPQAGVMFSDRGVITVRDAQPTLMIRLANARGNEVVDATVTISAILDELSPEGHHMRRLQDLSLVRDRQPMFALSWTLMHPIDASSPLYGVALDDPDAALMGLIVTLIGHDSTYGQTTYARKLYHTRDLLPEHRFVDVLSQLPDGRLMLDLERFHDVQPDPLAPPGDSAPL